MHGYHNFVLGDGMSYLEPPNSPPRPAHPLLMVLYFHVFMTSYLPHILSMLQFPNSIQQQILYMWKASYMFIKNALQKSGGSGFRDENHQPSRVWGICSPRKIWNFLTSRECFWDLLTLVLRLVWSILNIWKNEGVSPPPFSAYDLVYV